MCQSPETGSTVPETVQVAGGPPIAAPAFIAAPRRLPAPAQRSNNGDQLTNGSPGKDLNRNRRRPPPWRPAALFTCDYLPPGKGAACLPAAHFDTARHCRLTWLS
ncbi:hypothetical protein Adu01nite_36900 [Paractinoplanes durhamensis]|uniref:Uncharacterized protein n=1 Tax=Paractinoplanes durhamensis TaxID=113563 RepID=A0ABQ3YXM3_9ACTN|nr:hypothetical protein Adu01nite_36900 [Actinoplanes durhamensis]